MESPFISGGGLSFQNFLEKGVCVCRGGGGGRIFLQKGAGVSLSKVIFLSVCGLCVLLIYTIPITSLYVSQEGLSLVESNQQMYGFHKRVIFEQQRHCRPL